jgi:hypothetical protein
LKLYLIYYKPFLGLLVNLHADQSDNSTLSAKDGQCGRINPHIVQQVVAALWAVEVINNQSLPIDLKIGK